MYNLTHKDVCLQDKKQKKQKKLIFCMISDILDILFTFMLIHSHS